MVWKNPYLKALEELQMVAVLEKSSTIYRKGQTTVPIEVRNALGVAAGDSVTFRVERNGTVNLRKAEDEDSTDTAMDAFLQFLADDIRRRPSEVRPVTAALERRLRELTRGTVIDRANDRIEGDVGL
jgi:antitoxin PrlF